MAKYKVIFRGVVNNTEEGKLAFLEKFAQTYKTTPQKAQEFLVSMPRLALSNDLPGGNIQGGKQRRGTVPLVVVRPPLRQAGPEKRKAFIDAVKTGRPPHHSLEDAWKSMELADLIYEASRSEEELSV